MRKSLLIVGALMLLASYASAQDVTPYFKCTEKLEDPYGVCSHITRKGLDWELMDQEFPIMKAAGISNVRSDFDYFEVKNGKASEATSSKLDMSVSKCRENGVDLLAIISIPAKSVPWANAETYSEYVSYAAKRYNGDVKYWEYLNEVDLVKGFEKMPENYTKSLKTFYRTMKNVNKDNVVVFSGVSNATHKFFDDVCRLGIQNYFDVVNFHTYDTPERQVIYFDAVKKNMDKYGWNKPVWISEIGMHTAADKVKNVTNESREKTQAEWIARNHIISFAYGVDKVFWYNLRSRETDLNYSEDNFGLIHKDMSPKPSYIAYCTLTRMLPSGSTRPTLRRHGNIYTSTWVRPDNVKVVAVWCSNGSKNVKLSVTGRAQYYDHLGNRIRVRRSSQMEISGGVTYIVGAQDAAVK